MRLGCNPTQTLKNIAIEPNSRTRPASNASVHVASTWSELCCCIPFFLLSALLRGSPPALSQAHAVVSSRFCRLLCSLNFVVRSACLLERSRACCTLACSLLGDRGDQELAAMPPRKTPTPKKEEAAAEEAGAAGAAAASSVASPASVPTRRGSSVTCSWQT